MALSYTSNLDPESVCIFCCSHGALHNNGNNNRNDHSNENDGR